METTTILDCGHSPSVGHHGLGNGVVIVHPPVGAPTCVCYGCATKRDLMHIREGGPLFAYTSQETENGWYVTNWPGAALMTITHAHTGRVRWTPSGGWYRVLYVRALDPFGYSWSGRGPHESGTYVRLRRMKGKPGKPWVPGVDCIAMTRDALAQLKEITP